MKRWQIIGLSALLMAVATTDCMAQESLPDAVENGIERIRESADEIPDVDPSPETPEPAVEPSADSGSRFQPPARQTPGNILSIAPQEMTPRDRYDPAPGSGIDTGFAAPSPKIVLWESGEIRHRRLLFEEPLLERHGLTRNERWQPVISGGNFLGHAALLPFELIKKHHRRCENGTGWGLPGSRLDR